MEMWFLLKQAMQKLHAKLRLYLKELIIDNQGRLDNKKNNKNIVDLSTRPWWSFTLGTLELCQWRYLSSFNSF